MGVQDHHIVKTANHAKDPLDFTIPVAPVASQTNTVFGRYSPGFPFQIVGTKVYGTSFTNVTSIDVGTAPTAGGTFTSALNAQMTPANDTEVNGVLSATAANTYSRTNTAQIIVRYTTGTGPAAVNAYAIVIIRPRPLDGEVQ